jgi:drug/metabolite transporter (DMT)-like permease
VNDQTKGYLLGLVAVIAFSITLPVTRHAVQWMDPLFIGPGRAALAALPAAALLLWRRQRLPRGRQWPLLIATSLGVVVGFPYFSAWAMERVPSAHGGVVLGILPLATAVAGALFARERPSGGFWFFALLGSGLVVFFSLREGGWSFHWADLALLACVVSASSGYALGAELSRSLGGWQVISWSLVIAFPVMAPLAGYGVDWSLPQAPFSAWACFFYVAFVSQFLTFFAWYRALSLGGIGHVGQIQLTQAFFTLFFAWAFLNEAVGLDVVLFAAGVVACVYAGKKMPVRGERAAAAQAK